MLHMFAFCLSLSPASLLSPASPFSLSSFLICTHLCIYIHMHPNTSLSLPRSSSWIAASLFSPPIKHSLSPSVNPSSGKMTPGEFVTSGSYLEQTGRGRTSSEILASATGWPATGSSQGNRHAFPRSPASFDGCTLDCGVCVCACVRVRVCACVWVSACDEQRQAREGGRSEGGGLHHCCKIRDFSLSDCRGLSLSFCPILPSYSHLFLLSPLPLFIPFSQSSTFTLLHLFHALFLSSASFRLNLSPTVSFSLCPPSVFLPEMPASE